MKQFIRILRDVVMMYVAAAAAIAILLTIFWVKVEAWDQCRDVNSFLFCAVAIGGR